MPHSVAQYFRRREECLPEQTRPESPFRQFKVSCLKCRSHEVRIIAEWDGEGGELKLWFLCQGCHNQERLPVR